MAQPDILKRTYHYLQIKLQRRTASTLRYRYLHRCRRTGQPSCSRPERKIRQSSSRRIKTNGFDFRSWLCLTKSYETFVSIHNCLAFEYKNDIPRIGHQSGNRASDVSVHLYDLLDGGRLHQRGRNPLFDGQNHSFGSADSYGRRTEFDRFDGILDLEQSTLGRERVHSSVVLGAR